jgi:hypothetical protein
MHQETHSPADSVAHNVAHNVAGAAVAAVIGVCMIVKVDRLPMHCLVWLALFISGQALAAAGTADHRTSLIPAPLLSQPQEHAFRPGARVTVNAGESESMRIGATWLAGLISAHTGRELVVSGPGVVDAGIRLVLESEAEMRRLFDAAGLAPPALMAEAYGLSIGPAGVMVRAMGEAGLFYGMASLWQVLSLPPQSRNGRACWYWMRPSSPGAA